jgi:hypothetical protein
MAKRGGVMGTVKACGTLPPGWASLSAHWKETRKIAQQGPQR